MFKLTYKALHDHDTINDGHEGEYYFKDLYNAMMYFESLRKDYLTNEALIKTDIEYEDNKETVGKKVIITFMYYFSGSSGAYSVARIEELEVF